jgi:hypothetical protein
MLFALSPWAPSVASLKESDAMTSNAALRLQHSHPAEARI